MTREREGGNEAVALTIGQLARAADVNVETVRYYERRGLFPDPPRTRTGYRQYTEESVGRLRFIRRAQELGFTLKEIGEFLGLRARHVGACKAVERKAQQKIELVDGKIQELQRLKWTLDRLAAACARREPTGECMILEMLDDELSLRGDNRD